MGSAIQAALLGMALSALVAVALWGASFAVERLRGPLSPRARQVIGVGLLVVALVVGAVGLLTAHGDRRAWCRVVQARWTQFTSDQGPTTAGSRFADVGPSGRLELWRIGLAAFEERPLLGLGAENYETYFVRHRESGNNNVRDAHSRPVEVLAELGLPGLVLWLAVLAVALMAAVRARLDTRETGARRCWPPWWSPSCPGRCTARRSGSGSWAG